MNYKITISIINYRTAELTQNCVSSALNELALLPPDQRGKVVIVDNASNDGSAEQIETWLKGIPDTEAVQLVRSPVNSGFSGGHNQGMEACQADYYLLLNSDAVLQPGFLNAILEAGDASPDTGLIAPQLQYDDGTVQNNCFRFPSPASEFIRAACTGVVTRMLKKYEVALGPQPETKDIGWASFACILLRHTMVAEIGPMDEGYFLYFEDADYCLLAHRANWAIAYCPQAKAIHHRGGSGPVKTLTQENKRLPGYFYASRTRFLYHAHGYVGVIFANISWHAGRVLAQLRRLFGKPVYRLNDAEMYDIWTNVTQPLAKSHHPE